MSVRADVLINRARSLRRPSARRGTRRIVTSGTHYRRVELPDAKVSESAVDSDRMFRVIVSTDAPVWSAAVGMNQILSHEPGAIEMRRIDSGVIKFLWNHDSDRVIADVSRVVVEGGRMIATGRFLDTESGNASMREWMDGGTRSASLGFNMIEPPLLVGPGESWNGSPGPVMVAERWEPSEFSLTPIPADPDAVEQPI